MEVSVRSAIVFASSSEFIASHRRSSRSAHEATPKKCARYKRHGVARSVSMLRQESANEVAWSGAMDEHGLRCDRLHHRLKRIVKARAALDAQELECLREADRLRLWRRYGCASLVEYMERELGYSQRAAIERLRVIKAIADLP